MRAAVVAFLVASIGPGCGGRSAPSEEAPDAYPSDTQAPVQREATAPLGTGPIDAAGAPDQFVLDCHDGASTWQIAFALPCATGVLPLNVTECYSAVNRPPPVLAFMISLGYMAEHLGTPIDPSKFPRVPYAVPLTVDGIAYSPTKYGQLTPTQVDLAGGGFMSRVNGIEFSGVAPTGETVVCTAHDSVLWSIGAGFL